MKARETFRWLIGPASAGRIEPSPRRGRFVLVALGVGSFACGSGTAKEAHQGSLSSASMALVSEGALVSPGHVTVTFTFDDTWSSQLGAASLLEAYGMRGTFYVNSPRLHRATAHDASYLSIEDVRALQERGHEIGSHTLSHPNLTTLTEPERRREMFNDRFHLQNLGLNVSSIAYPQGAVEEPPGSMPSLKEIAAEAGFITGRDTNGIGLQGCSPGVEDLSPPDPFRIRGIRSVSHVPPAPSGEPTPPPDTAATLLSWIAHAASCGGGWLPLVFHHFREDCFEAQGPTAYCFSYDELEVLLSSLATGEYCGADGLQECFGVSVLPVNEVLGTEEPPPSQEYPGLRNPSFEREGRAECVQRRAGSSANASFSRDGERAHSGEVSERVRIDGSYHSPAEVLMARDFGACSVLARPRHRYNFSFHYRADPELTLPFLRFVVYRLSEDYEWRLWTRSPAFPAESPGSWVRRSFTTRPAPAGTVALTFGMSLESVGAVNVDDFAYNFVLPPEDP